MNVYGGPAPPLAVNEPLASWPTRNGPHASLLAAIVMLGYTAMVNVAEPVAPRLSVAVMMNV